MNESYWWQDYDDADASAIATGYATVGEPADASARRLRRKRAAEQAKNARRAGDFVTAFRLDREAKGVGEYADQVDDDWLPESEPVADVTLEARAGLKFWYGTDQVGDVVEANGRFGLVVGFDADGVALVDFDRENWS